MKLPVKIPVSCLAGLAAVLTCAATMAAPISPAVRTISLDPDHQFSVPSTVTYHPGFDRYYASDTGNSSYPGFVFDAAGGAPVQTQSPLGVDARAWSYNANTGQLEVLSYNACCGGAGLVLPGVDGTGNLTGGTSIELAAPLAGLASSQTAPAYNPTDNVFYSRDSSSTVNVVSRTDGALSGTIVLDYGSAGPISVPSDGVVYIPEEDWLGVLDQDADDLVVFDLSGNYIARIELDIDISGASSRPGYANGQLFAYDDARDLWQGFAVTDAQVQVDTPSIPTLSTWSILLTVLLMGLWGLGAMRRRHANQ